MAAPGFGQALMWGELSNQLGDWRNRNVDKRREQEEAARIAQQDARVGMLDQRAVDWRTQDLTRDAQVRSEDIARDDRIREQQRIEAANLRAAESKRGDLTYKRTRADSQSDDTRAFERQKELLALREAATPRASRTAPPAVRDEGEATTRLYETARDMALAGRSPQEIANFVARDDQPFKQFFRDPSQRFAIVNQAAQDAANARAKATPNGTQNVRERDMALAAARVRRLAGLDTPEANNLFLTNVQKVNDPGVAAMEADIKRLENTGTFGDMLGGWRNRLQGKGPLTENQKGRFVEAVDVMTGDAPAAGGISSAEAAQLRAMGYTEAEIRAAGGR